MQELLEEEPLRDTYTLRPRVVMNGLIDVLKVYCEDFYRHDLELKQGKAQLWKHITKNPSCHDSDETHWSWTEESILNDFNNNFKERDSRDSRDYRDNRDNNRSCKKTRWMEVTERLISLLLGVNDMSSNPENPQHLKRLIEYKDGVNDPKLKSILSNYCTTIVVP